MTWSERLYVTLKGRWYYTRATFSLTVQIENPRPGTRQISGDHTLSKL
jgi:hypothetical protein